MQSTRIPIPVQLDGSVTFHGNRYAISSFLFATYSEEAGRRMTLSAGLELEIHDNALDVNAVSLFVDFCQGRAVQVTPENAMDLLDLATTWSVPQLASLAAAQMAPSKLGVDNAITLLKRAHDRRYEPDSQLVEFARRSFLKLIERPGVFDIGVETIAKICEGVDIDFVANARAVKTFVRTCIEKFGCAASVLLLDMKVKWEPREIREFCGSGDSSLIVLEFLNPLLLAANEEMRAELGW
jgi:hypothetical protein